MPQKSSPKNKSPLVADCPDLLRDWHPENNAGLDIHSLTSASDKRAWWRCPKGHEWQVAIRQKNKGSSCPECRKRVPVAPEKSFAALCPDAAGEWHPHKNKEARPEHFTTGSGFRAWWQCPKGHEWETRISSRSRGSTCPECRAHPAADESLAYLYPDLAKEWHPHKNKATAPENIFPGSSKKYWWQCERGHEWQANVNNRVRGSGCPGCKHLPSPQESLAALRPDLAQEWHPRKNGSRSPEDFSAGSAENVWWQCPKGHEWQTLIFHRSAGTGCPTCRWIPAEGESLREKMPALAGEWHPRKNRDILPEGVTPSSQKKIWWQCPKGHIWQERVCVRASGSDCPSCGGGKTKRPLTETHPEIAREWHPTRNGNRRAGSFTHGSEHRAWWQCPKGHEWQAVIGSRTRGNRCPECFGSSRSENRLDVLYPDIAREWHPTRNGKKQPSQFSRGAKHRAWWQCSRGHEWQAVIGTRTSGSGCPDCYRIPDEKNSLAVQYPHLLGEIHPDKNPGLEAEKLTTMSHKKIWWQCPEGHEWQVPIYYRTRGQGCQKCLAAVPHDKSLQALLPDVAREWHPYKNMGAQPKDFSVGSDYEAWWQCERGHEWQAPIYRRGKGSGCRVCSRIVSEQESFAHLHPDVAQEWHPHKNKTKPGEVKSGSRYRAWWQCVRGHEWQATVIARSRGTRCPHCPRKVAAGASLAELYPDLAKEWHPRNGDLRPQDFSPGANRKVWWRCPEGHVWKATIGSRSAGSGCPECGGGGYKSSKPGYVYLMYSPKYACWQVGITNSPSDRIKKHKKHGDFRLIEVLYFQDGLQARELENSVLRSWRDAGYAPALSPSDMPQGGWSETVSGKDVRSISLYDYPLSQESSASVDIF